EGWLELEQADQVFPIYFMYSRESLADQVGTGAPGPYQEITLHEHIPVPFVLSCTGTASVEVQVEFDRVRYPHLDADAIVEQFCQLVLSISRNPAQPVRDAALWDARQWQALSAPIPAPRTVSVGAAFDAVAARRGSAAAV